MPIFARLLRGSMIAQAQSDYVLAATALGVRRRADRASHVLPNSLAPVIVQATLTLATAIIEAAALSFLGLGNPDPGRRSGAPCSPTRRTAGGPRRAGRSTRRSRSSSPRSGSPCSARRMREALDPKLRE